MTKRWYYATIKYIKKDWVDNRIRFLLEVYAWACSVISAIIFAATVPDIPVVLLYSIFISGCAATAWTCYTRGSFGLVANYICLVSIDGFGLLRYLITQ